MLRENNQKIDKITKTIDSLEGVNKNIQKELDLSQAIKEERADFPDEPRGGIGGAVYGRNGYNQLRKRWNERTKNNLKSKSDSLKNVNKKIKGN